MSVVGRLLERLDHRCFLRPDTEALVRGWTVRRDGIFTRTYRDPRFDALRATEPDSTRRVPARTDIT